MNLNLMAIQGPQKPVFLICCVRSLICLLSLDAWLPGSPFRPDVPILRWPSETRCRPQNRPNTPRPRGKAASGDSWTCRTR